LVLALSTVASSIGHVPAAEGAGGTFGGGDGSAGNPFVIEDVLDLQNMSANLSAHYVLGKDIDASATAGWNSGAGFIPVGTNTNRFTGSLDGRNHTITGLHINRTERSDPWYIGLFGVMDGSASVKDLGLVDVEIIGDRYVGGLAGYIYRGTVSSTYVTGNVSGRLGVGGLVGYNDGVISDSFAMGELYASSSNVGGLVGMNQGSVYDSYFVGNVSCRFHNGYHTGGLVGSNGGRVNGCHVQANVSGRDTVGGLVGGNAGLVRGAHVSGNVTGFDDVGGLAGGDSSRVYDAYFSGNVTGNTSVGGIIGACHGHGSNSHYDIDKVLINGGHHVTFGALYHAQYQDWYSNGLSLKITDYNTTLVPSGGYYDISTVQGLKDLLGFSDLSGYRFRLAADIDLKTAPGLYIPSLASDLDGSNHTVTDLWVNLSFVDKIGLVGESKGVTVNDIGVETCRVVGGFQVGGLVGYNNGGTVSGSHVRGYVNGSVSVGGLVGWNSGPISGSFAEGNVSGGSNVGGLAGLSNGNVLNSSAAVELNGSEGSVGGLVGRLAGATVFRSYATGDVTGYSAEIGGLVGSNNYGTVSNSYATGDVWGRTINVGGLVGDNRGTVRDSYSTGSAYARLVQDGGLVGWNLYGTVSNSFWDVNTSGMSSSDGGVGKTTREMKTKSTFTAAGWNFTDVWFIVENITYPALRWQEVGLPLADAGPDQRLSLGPNGAVKGALDGTGSTDDFGIFNYTWSFDYNGSEQFLYGEHAEFTFGIPGQYNVTLQVTDALGRQDTDEVNVTVEDVDPPTFGQDLTPITATTGDAMFFLIEVRDNVEVRQVIVNYYFEGTGVNHTLFMAMVPPGPSVLWTVGIGVPSDSLAAIHYQFGAVDNSSNGNLTDWSVITVLDDDSPELVSNGTPAVGYTGDTFTFSFVIQDNIGVNGTYVDYWYTGDPIVTRVYLTFDGSHWSGSITIQSDSLASLEYTLYSNDLANNTMMMTSFVVDVLDNDPPTFGVDASPGTAETDMSYTFNVSVHDNIGVDAVWVEYWYGDGTRTNASMTFEGAAWEHWMIVADTLDSLHYSFGSIDTSGNVNLTGERTAEVVDINGPQITNEGTGRTATTGDPFEFTLTAYDNVGLRGVTLWYAYGDAELEPVEMEVVVVNPSGNVLYSLVIDVRADFVGDITYRLELEDLYGNVFTTFEEYVRVVDDDPPVLLVDATDDSAHTGDPFWAEVDVSENVEMAMVNFSYWFTGGEPVTLALELLHVSGSGNATYGGAIDVPNDSIASLHYLLELTDAAGNVLRTDEREVAVVDDEAPTFGADLSDEEAFRNGMFHFDIEVNDNVDVVELRCEWWFGDGEHINATKPLDTRIAIDVPEHPAEPLRYLFSARDAAGNWNSPSPTGRPSWASPPSGRWWRVWTRIWTCGTASRTRTAPGTRSRWSAMTPT